MRSIKIRTGYLFALLVSMVWAQGASSEIVDMKAEINKRLAKAPMVKKTRQVPYTETICLEFPCVVSVDTPVESSDERVISPQSTEQRIEPQSPMGRCTDCRKVARTRSEVYTTPARATSIEVELVNSLEVVEAKVNSLPDEILTEIVEDLNCTDNKERSTLSVSLDMSNSWDSRVTKGVNYTKSLTANVGFKGKLVNAGLSGTYSTTVSLTNSQGESERKGVSTTKSIPITVDPGHKYILKYLGWQHQASIPFVGEVVVNGNLEPNNDNKKRISAILNQKQRTITVKGLLNVSLAGQTKIVRNSVDESKGECADSENTGKHVTRRYNETSLSPSGKSTFITTKSFVDELLDEKVRPLVMSKKTALKDHLLGTPGAWCYTGPCNDPLDGYREVCYSDEEGYCQDCRDEWDSVCEPPDEPPADPCEK